MATCTINDDGINTVPNFIISCQRAAFDAVQTSSINERRLRRPLYHQRYVLTICFATYHRRRGRLAPEADDGAYMALKQ